MAPQIFGDRVGMASLPASSRGFGHEFGRFDFAFRHHDFERFRDRNFDRDNRFRNRDSDRGDPSDITILVAIVMTFRF